ncbi:hypothetical protein C8R45DRAFT_1115597 [Mycena sanguinolenta]|nr:hypothetical protein C8R45DRAFT_1115597 [Mycena sanguinolenta]
MCSPGPLLQVLDLTTSSSRRVNVGTSERVPGRARKRQRTLTTTQIIAAKDEEERRETERRLNLSRKQQLAEQRIRDIPDAFDHDDGYEDDVLHGCAAADISNAGEGLVEEELRRANQSLLEGLQKHHKLYSRRADRD